MLECSLVVVFTRVPIIWFSLPSNWNELEMFQLTGHVGILTSTTWLPHSCPSEAATLGPTAPSCRRTKIGLATPGQMTSLQVAWELAPALM